MMDGANFHLLTGAGDNRRAMLFLSVKDQTVLPALSDSAAELLFSMFTLTETLPVH